MEPKCFNDINSYIDEIIKRNYFIPIDYITKILDDSDISFREKAEIIKKVDLCNKKTIKIFEQEIETLSKPIEDDKTCDETDNDILKEVTHVDTIPNPRIIKLPSIKNHIQQLFLLTSDEEFESYLKSSIDKTKFHDTINLLIADILENIITIKKLINEDLLNSGSKCVIFNNELDKLNSILNVLYRLQYYTDVKHENRQNKIIYLATEAGNISISNDLKAIPIEFYDSIYSLLKSIQDGTFRGFKRIGTQTNNFKTNLLQVRENFTRIIFDQLDDDLYIILTVFIKKVSTSKEYFNNLRNVDSLLSRQIPYLHKQLQNNRFEFLELNDYITESLFRKLLTKNKEEDINGKVNIKH